jgi:hypothetical protein
MKQLFILLLLVSVFSTQAQQTKSVRFCFRQMPVSPECTVESEYEIRDGQATLSWVYVADDNMIFAANGLLKKLENYPEFTKEHMNAYLLDHRVSAYRVSFKKGSEKVYQIIAYGIVNNQPVMVQLCLNKQLTASKDIPSFALPFIRI